MCKKRKDQDKPIIYTHEYFEKNSKKVLPTHICGRRRNWDRMGFKISEKFKECLGNALSAIIRVFLYFVIFEEKVNAVVYILATFKF